MRNLAHPKQDLQNKGYGSDPDDEQLPEPPRPAAYPIEEAMEQAQTGTPAEAIPHPRHDIAPIDADWMDEPQSDFPHNPPARSRISGYSELQNPRNTPISPVPANPEDHRPFTE